MTNPFEGLPPEKAEEWRDEFTDEWWASRSRDPGFMDEITPEMREGYRVAREMYGDDYAAYLIAADEEHWKYALDCGLEFEPTPWPLSLIGNDGD